MPRGKRGGRKNRGGGRERRGRRVWKRSEKSSEPEPSPRPGEADRLREARAGRRRGAAHRRWPRPWVATPSHRPAGRGVCSLPRCPGGAGGTRPPSTEGSPGGGGRGATLTPHRTGLNRCLQRAPLVIAACPDSQGRCSAGTGGLPFYAGQRSAACHLPAASPGCGVGGGALAQKRCGGLGRSRGGGRSAGAVGSAGRGRLEELPHRGLRSCGSSGGAGRSGSRESRSCKECAELNTEKCVVFG